jgi:nuclear RNA export factor
MIVLTVSGLFKERSTNPKAEHARCFQKTLVIVPNNGGFCIKNEMLHINNASQTQARAAFKEPIPIAPTNMTPSTSQQLDDNTKLRMVEEMSKVSNMNLEWSRKCLEETQWDYNRAGFVFQELFKQSKIPPEAFVK